MSNEVLRAQPPTNWVEQLDEAIERLTDELVDPGVEPAQLVASWLAWYAHELAQISAQRADDVRRTDRAMWLAQRLTDIIVDQLNGDAGLSAEVRVDD